MDDSEAFDEYTAGLLWNEYDGFHLMMPEKYQREDYVPEEAGVLAALVIRLVHDGAFYREQVAWMDEQLGHSPKELN